MSWSAVAKSNSAMNLPVKKVKTVSMKEFLDNRNNYREVSRQLSDLFDNINSMVRTSSQRAASAQINYNQRNHDRWHAKKADEQDDNEKILSEFNIIALGNYNTVFEVLKTLNIYTYDEMKKIVDETFDKLLSDKNTITVFSNLSRDIMLNCEWITYDEQCKPTSFRKVLMEKFEEYFNTTIDKIKHSGETRDLNVKMVQKNFFVSVAGFFERNIISDQLLRFISNSLETAFIETNINEFVEYWIILINVASKYWIGDKSVYMTDKNNFITRNCSKFSQKVNILIKDIGKVEKVEHVEQVKLVENSFAGYDIKEIVESVSESDINTWYETIIGIDESEPGFVNEVIKYLSNRTTDSKETFTLLNFLLGKPKHEKVVKKMVTDFMKTCNNEVYIKNANKLLKTK